MEISGVFLTASDLWLLGAAGIAFGWLVLNRLTIEQGTRTRRAAACAEFRRIVHAITQEMPVSAGWDRAIIQEMPNKCKSIDLAVAELMPHLPKAKRRGLAKEWKAMQALCKYQIPGAKSSILAR